MYDLEPRPISPDNPVHVTALSLADFWLHMLLDYRRNACVTDFVQQLNLVKILSLVGHAVNMDFARAE
jgi:hypothetical protein